MELLRPIETIEYWFYAQDRRQRIRIHKSVHFYLMKYRSGDVRHHDEEVREARWVEIGEATRMLTFKGEGKVMEKARDSVATHRQT